jgi:hypothetical protein
LFDKLQKNPPPWTTEHTSVVKEVKIHVQTLPCLGIPTIESFKIVETDVSNIGYGGILKQQVHSNQPEQIVRSVDKVMASIDEHSNVHNNFKIKI